MAGLKSPAKTSEYENASDDGGKGIQLVDAVDVLREKEQVRQILASAAALQAETSQSEWSDDDDDDLSYISNDDDEIDDDVDDDDDDGCQGPLLGGVNDR